MVGLANMIHFERAYLSFRPLFVLTSINFGTLPEPLSLPQSLILCVTCAAEPQFRQYVGWGRVHYFLIAGNDADLPSANAACPGSLATPISTMTAA
jgi:hypothetical protein